MSYVKINELAIKMPGLVQHRNTDYISRLDLPRKSDMIFYKSLSLHVFHWSQLAKT